METLEKEKDKQAFQWQDCLLFKDISNDHLFQLEVILKEEKFEAGEKIIKEGEAGDSVYLIISGEVDIQKDTHHLATKSTGDHFGAMALIEETTRSADVIAIKPTLVKTLSIQSLKSLAEKGVYTQVLTNHVKSQQLALRNMNSVTIQQIKAKLKQSQSRVLSGRFIVGVVFLLVSYQFLLGLFIEYNSSIRKQEYLEILNPALIFVFGFIAFLMAYSSKVPLSAFGINLRNWKTNLIESLLWTAGFLGVVIGIKWLVINFVSGYEGYELFDQTMVNQSSGRRLLLLNIAYFLLAPVQEFIVRGLIQGSLQRLLTGPKRIFWAILLSNMMFSALHLHNDMSFALGTLIPGFFWGIMYYRQKSLLGVSLSHIIIGLLGLVYLTFQ